MEIRKIEHMEKIFSEVIREAVKLSEQEEKQRKEQEKQKGEVLKIVESMLRKKSRKGKIKYKLTPGGWTLGREIPD